MAITTFSTNFGDSLQNAAPVICGLPSSVLNGISPFYIVVLNAFKGNQPSPYLTINAYLQENFVLAAGSKWEGISQMFGGVDDTADTVVQLGTTALSAIGVGDPRSLVSAASSRRKWKGSEPINIKMKLKLEAVNDAYTEVILPCMRLKQLTLPREGNAGGFFLIPPGPSPFNIGKNAFNDVIELSIGGFLNFSYTNCGGVVVNNVSVTYENRMGSVGPIGAVVDIDVSTYQMLSQEALSRVYGINNPSAILNQNPPALGNPTPSSAGNP